MGNTSSTNSNNSNKSSEKEFDNFYDIIDYIATYYILTMDFKSLSKLSEKEYCDKLVVLTSDIIKRYFKLKGSKFFIKMFFLNIINKCHDLLRCF